MRAKNAGYFYHRLVKKKKHFPLDGQIELTYRCGLNCVHCYCKGMEFSGQNPKDKELTTAEFKKILDEIHSEGCIWITFTGGDPLVREDFLEIYSYARQKGFLITIFTSGQAFSDEIINFLVKSPPHWMEITLNGITKETYENITQVRGSYSKAIETIKLLAKRKFNLKLKTNCLKYNRDEIAKIKEFSEQILGKPSGKTHYFQYDEVIYPRLNGDRSVCNHRLSFPELLNVRRQDRDIWEEYQKRLSCKFPELRRDRNYLYGCNTWMNRFFINPYGRLKFCVLSDKFSIDLKTAPFREGFYNIFPKLLNEKFKTNSKCKDCPLRPICYWCPARAYLEAGDEEAPIDYYCKLARATSKAKLQQSS